VFLFRKGQRADNRGWGGFRAHPSQCPGHRTRRHQQSFPLRLTPYHGLIGPAMPTSDTLDISSRHETQDISARRPRHQGSGRKPLPYSRSTARRLAFLGYNSIIKPEWIARRKTIAGMAPLTGIRPSTRTIGLPQPGTPAKIWTLPVLDDMLALRTTSPALARDGRYCGGVNPLGSPS